MTRLVWCLCIAATVIVTGCARHELTYKGQGVFRAYTLTDVKDCERIATINAEMSSGMRLAGAQGEPAGDNDLLIDARNKAGAHGADFVLPVDAPHASRQEFSAYRCP